MLSLFAWWRLFRSRQRTPVSSSIRWTPPPWCRSWGRPCGPTWVEPWPAGGSWSRRGGRGRTGRPAGPPPGESSPQALCATGHRVQPRCRPPQRTGRCHTPHRNGHLGVNWRYLLSTAVATRERLHEHLILFFHFSWVGTVVPGFGVLVFSVLSLDLEHQTPTTELGQ